jgi:hypothetical protein
MPAEAQRASVATLLPMRLAAARRFRPTTLVTDMEQITFIAAGDVMPRVNRNDRSSLICQRGLKAATAMHTKGNDSVISINCCAFLPPQVHTGRSEA